MVVRTAENNRHETEAISSTISTKFYATCE